MSAAKLPLLVFTIPGRPVPLERARVKQKQLANGKRVTHAHTPPRSKAYRQLVQLHMNLARGATARSDRRWPVVPMPDPIRLTLHIFWADLNHGDGSNLLKGIEDAGNELLWSDDKQIVEGHFYCSLDRAHPRVEVIAEVVELACSECISWKFMGRKCPAHDDRGERVG